jgi:hypothetical protein
MSARNFFTYALIGIVGAVVVATALRLGWLAIGAYRIHQAGPRPLSATRHTIWRDPGNVEQSWCE